MTISDVRGAAGVMLLLASIFTTLPAGAETDEERAVVLFAKGRKLAREGRCAEAIAPLLESIRYAEGVGPLLNLGNCYESLGKTASAHRWFLRAQEVARGRADARGDEAALRARSIEKDVSMLVVQIPSSIRSNAEVRVDGEPWPRDRWGVPAPIDPGAHEIELSIPPHVKQAEKVTVRGKGDRVEWTAATPLVTKAPPSALTGIPPTPTVESERRSEDAASPTSSIQRTLGLVTGGVGIGGLVAGAIFGVLSISAHSSLVGRCPTYPRCPLPDRGALDDLNSKAMTTGTISTISVFAGVALLAGGAALFFTAPAQPLTHPER